MGLLQMRVWRGGHGISVMVVGLWLAMLTGLPATAHEVHHTPYHHARRAVHHFSRHHEIHRVDSTAGPTSPGVSSILIDARSGRVISAHGADIPRYPASLTKLMTLDLTFQALRDGRITLNTRIPVSAQAATVEPVKLGLRPGATITVRNAILAMTTMSANDAATALGQYLGGGSIERCAQMMTLRAHELGMAQTHFNNPSGLPNPNQVTTARDIALLARDIVLHYPQEQPFFEAQSFDFHGRQIYSNNNMLKIYPGTTGMKTGYTNLARFNLVTSAVRDHRMLIGVVLHETSWGTSYKSMTAMLDYGFAHHEFTHPGNGTESELAMAQARHHAGALPTPHRVIEVASHTRHAVLGNWVAQLGAFTHMTTARTVAVRVRAQRGVGIARIAKVEHRGHTLWAAQLAGLSYHAAHETCNRLAAHGQSCMVLAPATDHLAMLVQGDGA